GRAARPRVAATRSRPRCRHAGDPGLVAAADVLFGHLLRVGGRQVRTPRATRRTRSRGSNLAPWDRRRDLILRGKRLPRRSTLTREAPTHITHPTAERTGHESTGADGHVRDAVVPAARKHRLRRACEARPARTADVAAGARRPVRHLRTHAHQWHSRPDEAR